MQDELTGWPPVGPAPILRHRDCAERVGAGVEPARRVASYPGPRARKPAL